MRIFKLLQAGFSLSVSCQWKNGLPWFSEKMGYLDFWATFIVDLHFSKNIVLWIVVHSDM